MKQVIRPKIISFILKYFFYTLSKVVVFLFFVFLYFFFKFSEIQAKQKICYLHSCFSDTYTPVAGLHFLFLAGLPKNIPLVNSNNMGQFRLEVSRWCLVDFCPLLLGLNKSHFFNLSVSQKWDNILCYNLFLDLNGRKVQDSNNGRY